MGMTIDLAKDILKHPTDYFPSEIDEANAYAIETMRKYQKIEQLMKGWNNAPSPYYKPDGQLFREIIEVLEDGKID